MKRFFFLAAAATAMLAACNKTEIVPADQPQEISFVAVNKVATKTPVDGTAFRDTDNMAVAAYIVDGAINAGGTNAPANFFDYTLFSKSGELTWSGNPARYWPLNTATINFLAVTEVGGGVDKTKSIDFNDINYASAATVVLDGNDVYNQSDLMFAAGQGTHNQGYAYTAVPMIFKHALSWINFKVATNTPAAGETSGCTITINSITLNNAVYKGTLSLESANAAKISPAPSTGGVAATWEKGAPTAAVKVPNAGGSDAADAVTLTSTPQLFGNGLLVVPDGYADSFTINYTLTQNGGPANTYNYTYTLNEGVKWSMAKKYFYNITITLSEILIAPSVEDWIDDDRTVSIN
ncbi:MAG: fimbrillin family protein [Bacteroidales bacterium]|nr:fimbrillin family protein [Bacteroidales bacterium]